MSIINAHPLLAAAGADGYQISRSVRLRSSASAYFNRTFAAGSQTTWTFSIWFKLGTLGVNRVLISCGSGATDSIIYINTGNTLFLNLDNVTCRASTQVFRDPSAWYHLVVALDTSNATAQNRIRAYINGVEITSWVTNNTIAQNATPSFNSAIAHNISLYTGGGGLYFDGYLTETNWINGQALTPSSFGETNAITGVWQPKKYAGTYGTNGFYLNFSDNSAVTTSSNVGIGKDFSGNGNYWTSNSISVSAGVTYDSMLDVPTLYADGGNGRGNYATLNAVDLGYSATTSEANLKVSTASSGNAASASTMALSTNTYWEVTIGSNSQVGLIWGRASDAYGNSSISMFANGATGSLANATRTLSATPSWSNGDTLGLAWNSSTRVLTLYQAGSATAVMTILTPATGDPQAVVTNYTSASAMSSQVNFGQRPFTYTPPTGFKALNTQNLPTPTINNGASYMAATLYSGNSGTQSITNTVNGVSFQPDFVWGKSRNIAENHALFDIVRGVNKTLYANLTNAEATDPGVSAFNSNGFTLNGATINATGYTYVAWQWNAGGSTVTNTSGTISSQVRANPTAGFSVVTYTGTGANATVGHGLNATPAMIMVKNRDSGAIGGAVYHTSMGATKYLKLFQTTTGSDQEATDNTAWNGGSPTFNSSVFSVGSLNRTNSSQQMVAYCFAAVAGYSAFGKYTGNNSTDGPFVYLGFRPRFVLVKRTDVAATWYIWNTSSNTFNVIDTALFPNLSNAESSNVAYYCDILSNGFKPRATNTDVNASTGTYIYMAFAENPFKLSLAR
jgi:hypothetical protein